MAAVPLCDQVYDPVGFPIGFRPYHSTFSFKAYSLLPLPFSLPSLSFLPPLRVLGWLVGRLIDTLIRMMIRYFCCFLARNYLPLPVVHPPNPLRLPPPTNPGLPINCHFYIPLKLSDSSQTCASHPLFKPPRPPICPSPLSKFTTTSTRRLRTHLLLHQMPQLSTNPHSPQTNNFTAHRNPRLNDSLSTALRQPADTLPNVSLVANTSEHGRPLRVL